MQIVVTTLRIGKAQRGNHYHRPHPKKETAVFSIFQHSVSHNGSLSMLCKLHMRLPMRTTCSLPLRPSLRSPNTQADLERETGIEPATFSLARRCSTTEPLPHHCETLTTLRARTVVGGERLELSRFITNRS